MVERRREHRHRTLLGGRIIFRRLQATMDCIVRNITPRGAMVVFLHSAVTPPEFRLEIPHRREVHVASVIWRRHDRLGVALSNPDKHEASIDRGRRIRRLQAENRRLQRQLDQKTW